MGVQDHPEFLNHEEVVFLRDAETGVRVIIALHSTRLGPAAGGCRMHPYPTEDAALADALRLSVAMSYKNALAGLPLGGGKAVVIADPAAPGKAARLAAVARQVKRLAGRYWSAIDVGVGPDDAEVMARTCPYVFANSGRFPPGVSCASYTALGGFSALRALVRLRLARESLEGVHVAVQGIGQVGMDLCRRLHRAGARLTVADVNAEACARAAADFGAAVVSPQEVHTCAADVFAPCALGGILNDDTIPELGASLVCGLANNQLEAKHHERALVQRGVTWAPDYVVNAGGMLGSSGPIYGERDQARLEARVEEIGAVLARVIERADRERKPPGEVAARMAEERLSAHTH